MDLEATQGYPQHKVAERDKERNPATCQIEHWGPMQRKSLTERRTGTAELQGAKARSSPCGLPQKVTSVKNLTHQLLLTAKEQLQGEKT